jgi:hypothetical protein
MSDEFPSITCPRCKKVSYHGDDIKYKYCNHCHDWHEFMDPNLENKIESFIESFNKK